MAVRFLKSTTASALNRTLRPSGYSFPTGLSVGSITNPTVDYLIVAGGGGGSVNGYPSGVGGSAGAGGAGGLLTGTQTVSASTPYTVTVGGGAPGAVGR